MTGVISKKDMLNLIEDMTEDCENATHEVVGIYLERIFYYLVNWLKMNN